MTRLIGISGRRTRHRGYSPVLVLTFLLCLLPGFPLRGQEFRFAEPARFLGMTLESALEELGEPETFYPFRGETSNQDTVVFYYPEHVYLYWFENRVWQVRFDHRFEGPVMGISFGEDRLEVKKLLGPPDYQDEVSFVYELEHSPFPVRARVFFVEDALHDIYIYRGDF